MRILVTNDDGVHSEGIGVLAAEVAGAGHDVFVAAPTDDRSGTAAALGVWHADEHIDVEAVALPACPEVAAYAVDGPPALAVFAAHLGGFGDAPDLVVSGINPGTNTGRAVLHSGTVGAALTAANLGMSGLAVSQQWDEDGVLWPTGATLAGAALAWLVEAPERTVVNLNVPNVPIEEVLGVRWARLARFGTVRAAVAEASDGRLQMELRAIDEELPPDTDTALVLAGYAAITALEGPKEAAPVPVAEVVEQRLPRRSAS